MRIVMDARKLGDYGIGTYIEGIGSACIQLAPQHTFVFLSVARQGQPDTSRPESMSGPNVRWYANRSPNYSISELFSVSRQARQHRADVFHAPHYVYPLMLPCPGIVTVHDCIHLRFPNLLPNRLAPMYARAMLWHAVRSASKVITASQATRSDLIELVGAPADKIEIIPIGCDPFFFETSAAAELEAARDRYDLQRPFLLYVGNLKPHKNLDRLIKAFGQIADRRPELDLVLVGADVDGHPSLQRIRQDVDLAPRVRFPGYLPRAHLRALYQLAAVFVFPSLYEGFGLPPLEAMACGTPVVAADTSSLPEVVGDAGVLVNPFNVQSIAEGIERVLSSPQLRDDLAAMGRERAASFRWADAARAVLDLYERAAR